MAETYNLAIVLTYHDNASKGIASTVKQLQKLQTEGKQTISVWNSLQKTVNKGFSAKTEKLFSQLQKIQSEGKQTLSVWNSLQKGVNKDFQSKGFSSLLKDLNKVQKESKETLSVIKSLQNTVNKGFQPKGEKLSDFVKTDKKSRRETPDEELDRITGKRTRRGNYIDRLANVNDRFIEPTRQIADSARREYESLKKYTDETKKLYLAQAKFKLINLSPEQNQKAFDAVTKSVREMGLVTRAEGIEVLTDLHNIFGSLPAALEAFPTASKYRFSMETLFGDRYSSSQITEQIQNTMKFLELTDKVSKGRVEMEKWFDTMTRITASTGGRITGADFLNMAKTGGVSVQNLTPEGLINMSTIMQELGGDRTGTSMMSMYQALVGGVMKQSAAERFDYFGLLDRSKIEFGKAQKIKRILPGANKLTNLMMEDPLKAGDMLREAMQAKGVNVNDDKSVNKELALLFGNRNAQRLMSILMTQRDQVIKEANLAKNAVGNEGMFKIASEDELGKIKRFEKALVEFKTEAGIPLIQIGTKLAQTFTPILKFFGEHQTIAQWTIYTIGAAKGLKLLAETASILRFSGVSSFFSGTIGQANSMGTALGNANTKAKGLKGTLQNLASSSALKIGIGVVVAEGGIKLLETLVQHINEVDERIANTTKNAKTLREIYDNLAGRGLTYNAPGDLKDSKKDFDNFGKTFTETIREGRTLETNLHPERAGWWEHYKNLTELPFGSYTGGKQFNPTVAAQRWSSQGITQRFSDPNILASAIANVLRGVPIKVNPEDPNSETKPMLNLGDIKLVLQALEKTTTKGNFQTALALAEKQVYGDKKPETIQSRSIYDLTKPRSIFELTKPQSPILPRGIAGITQVPIAKPFFSPIKPFGEKTTFGERNIFREKQQSFGEKKLFDIPSFDKLNQPINETSNALGNLKTSATNWQDSMLSVVRQSENISFDLFNQGLSDLVSPIPQTRQDIFSLGDTSAKAVSPIEGLLSAALRISGGLNSVGNQLATWKAPIPQVQTFRIGIDASGNPVTTGKTAVTGNARGGVVESDGVAYLHAGNIIVPARVSRTFGTNNALNIFRQNPRNLVSNNQSLLSGLITSKRQDNFGTKSFTNFKEASNKSQFRENNLSKKSIGSFNSISNTLNFAHEKDVNRTERFNDVREFARERERKSSGNSQPINVTYNPTINIPPSGKNTITKADVIQALREDKVNLERMLARIMKDGKERG